MKRLVAALVIVLMAVSGLGLNEVRAAGFSDVSQYKNEITYLTDKKIINGYPDGTFKPDRDLTRLQAISMILREKGISDFTAPDPGFIDSRPGDYGYEMIAKAVSLGFISGKTNTDGSKYFDASASLTRGQMAKILVEGYKLPLKYDVIFTDVPANNTFKDYISVLATENITTGFCDGPFRPAQKLSRQHFAVFMACMLDDQFKPSVKPEPKPEPDFESGLYVIPGAPTIFKNCTEMRKYYSSGVKKGHPAYDKKHDRDNDEWACER